MIGLTLLLGLSFACARRPVDQRPLSLLSDEDLVAAFEPLHRRVYGTYAVAVERRAIHDLLSQSFSGEALTREYIDHWTTRVRMQRERTSIEVLRVDYESIEVVARDRDTVVVDADWSVGGIVSHQEHRHPRVNRYRAVFTLGLLDSRRVEEAARDEGELQAALRIRDSRLRNLERSRNVDALASPFEDLPTSGRGTFSAEDLVRSGLFEEVEADQGAAESPEEPDS